MELRVKLFAQMRELAGMPAVLLNLPDRATVGDVSTALGEAVPALGPFLSSVRFAVNQQFADLGAPVRPEDEVALISPVSGG